jgi:hypothetical protein
LFRLFFIRKKEITYPIATIKKIMKNIHTIVLTILVLSIFVGGCITTNQTNSADKTNCVLPSNFNKGISIGDTVTHIFPYVVNGQKGSVELTLNRQLRDYFACRSDEMGPSKSNQKSFEICIPLIGCKSSETTSTFENAQELIYESKKYSALKPLVDAIKSKSTDPEMQARIAINLVQHIPFNCVKGQAIDASNYNPFATHFDSPYEVLYENSGICGEKSALLASILNELGYDSAYLDFLSDFHSVTGIGGSESDQYLNTGYILIETTNPSPIGYRSSSIQHTNPNVVKLSGGAKFYLNSQDRIDSQNLQNLVKKQKEGSRLSNNEILLGDDLIMRYGHQGEACNGV